MSKYDFSFNFLKNWWVWEPFSLNWKVRPNPLNSCRKGPLTKGIHVGLFSLFSLGCPAGYKLKPGNYIGPEPTQDGIPDINYISECSKLCDEHRACHLIGWSDNHCKRIWNWHQLRDYKDYYGRFWEILS